MAQPVREDTTQDVILRVSQAKGTIIVEEHRTGGIISYREISPLELYYLPPRSDGAEPTRSAGGAQEGDF